MIRSLTPSGLPGVSLLWLDEIGSLICNFCFSVTARPAVYSGTSLRYSRYGGGTFSWSVSEIQAVLRWDI